MFIASPLTNDAVLQATATGYIDSTIFANYVDNSKCPMLELAKYMVNNGANLELYKKRAEILENTGRKRRLICGLMELDCQFNVTNLIEVLMKDAPSIWEYHTCNIEATQSIVPKIFIPINLAELLKGIVNINLIYFKK